MAAGSSAPEVATSLVTVFTTQDSTGLGPYPPAVSRDEGVAGKEFNSCAHSLPVSIDCMMSPILVVFFIYFSQAQFWAPQCSTW